MHGEMGKTRQGYCTLVPSFHKVMTSMHTQHCLNHPVIEIKKKNELMSLFWDDVFSNTRQYFAVLASNGRRMFKCL